MKIETLEQLEALPEGTVIEDSGGGITRRIDDGSWSEIGQTIGLWTYDSEEIAKYLPAVVLIPATVSQEKFEDAVYRLTSTYRRTGFVNALESALSTLGIEVSDE